MVSTFNYAGEIGPAMLIIVDSLLFVFPEPTTSVLGTGLVLFDATCWFWEWGRP